MTDTTEVWDYEKYVEFFDLLDDIYHALLEASTSDFATRNFDNFVNRAIDIYYAMPGSDVTLNSTRIDRVLHKDFSALLSGPYRRSLDDIFGVLYQASKAHSGYRVYPTRWRGIGFGDMFKLLANNLNTEITQLHVKLERDRRYACQKR